MEKGKLQSGHMGRRGFIGASAAAALAGCRTWLGEGKEFSIGFMTDTHVGETRESCARVEGAYRIFRREGCEVIVNAGDIADRFYPEGYRHYRAVSNETYPDRDSRPVEIFVYANHDTLGYGRKPGETKWDAFPHVKRLLEIEHDPWDRIVHKGYEFVIVPQSVDLKRYEKTVAEACAANPGKRVFLCDHMPGSKTTFNTAAFGDSRRRRILERYPQVVALTGHIHGSLRDPRQVWSGSYTCVNAGCLQHWSGNYAGIAPSAKNEYGVFVIDVYPSRLVFRRFDVRTGKPFEPDGWENVERYRGELWQEEDREWRLVSARDVESPFYLPEGERRPVTSVQFNPACFDEGRRYRIDLTPVDFKGKTGARRVVEEGVARGCERGSTVYLSDSPMEDMPFMYGLDGGRPVARKDGFYDYTGRNARLVFPKGIWKGVAGTRFRYVLDVTTEQGDGQTWSMTLRNPSPLTNAHSRLYTVAGKPGTLRYAVEFKKENADFDYYLLFREGPPGRIRFDRMHVERFDGV